MYAIIDRLSGEELGSISNHDMKVLQDVLAEEGPLDTDYYLQEGTLELLSQAGLSPDGMQLLQRGLEHRGGEIEFGWEPTDQSTTALQGTLVQEKTDHPFPGLKVALAQGSRPESWAFSRQDGRFEVNLPQNSNGVFRIRISGLEDTELWLGEVDVEAGVVEDMGTLEVPPINPPEMAVEALDVEEAQPLPLGSAQGWVGGIPIE